MSNRYPRRELRRLIQIVERLKRRKPSDPSRDERLDRALRVLRATHSWISDGGRRHAIKALADIAAEFLDALEGR